MWTLEDPQLCVSPEHRAALQRTCCSYNSSPPATTSTGPGILSWRSFCEDPCSQGSQVCHRIIASFWLESKSLPGEPWEADVHGGCKFSFRELQERRMGCRRLPSSPPKLQRSLLAVQSTSSSQLHVLQTDSRHTHKPEAGAAKPHAVLLMKSMKKMYFMQHGLFELVVTRNITFKWEEYVQGRELIRNVETKHISFPFLPLSTYFTAVRGYPLSTSHCALLLKGFQRCAAQHCTRQMFYCCFPRLSGRKASN